MRHLIDTYIRAEEPRKLSAFEDIPLVQLIVERGMGALQDLPQGITSDKEAMAETIENNLRRLIIDEQPTNPVYYEKMSEVLDTLIQERKDAAQDYEQYLAKIVELARQVSNPTASTRYPSTLNTSGQRVLYDNLGQDEQKALAVHDAVVHTKKDGWRKNKIKEREVGYAILGVLQDEEQANSILDIVKRQHEY